MGWLAYSLPPTIHDTQRARGVETVVRKETCRAMQQDSDSNLEGTILGGKYELVRRIGAGGMGEVYRGRQLSTGGRVAIKLMDARDRPAKTLARFRYEAETTAQLTHPNTVRILDFGGEQDLLYLVMEYLS